MGLPKKVDYLIVSAGVLGLATAYYVVRYLKAKDQGSGQDIMVLEKSSIAVEASGLARGNVCCKYFQEPMTRLMMHCMGSWESEPNYSADNSIGCLTVSFLPMREALEAVHQRHQELGYPSTLVVGEKELKKDMQRCFYDRHAKKREVLLHEHRGSHAWSRQAIHGLAIKAEREDVRILNGPDMTGFQFDNAGGVRAVLTDMGKIEVGHVIVAIGPWIKKHWRLVHSPLELPDPQQLGQKTASWRFPTFQEDEIDVNPFIHITNDGRRPPLIHVDSDVPLCGEDGKLVWDKP